jgi:hypothetical protein
MESDNSMIVGSSYCVYEGAPRIDSDIWNVPGGVSSDSKTVTFYTFDGNPIITVLHNMKHHIIENNLDKSAPKPKPSSYRRIWWPAFNMGFGIVKGAPGYAILFHDKNGNRIGWERMPSIDTNINECVTKYDISEAREEPSDFTLKPTNLNQNCCLF